jgi:hypothetical protein
MKMSTSEPVTRAALDGATTTRRHGIWPSISTAAVATLPTITGERELRIDMFRGLALWLIYIDHVSPDVLAWFTIRNYGFSDAAEIFIFISGFTAAFVYGRTMFEGGFVIGSARILRRAWQIYCAHLLLFSVLIAEVALVTGLAGRRSTCRRWKSRTSSGIRARP